MSGMGLFFVEEQGFEAEAAEMKSFEFYGHVDLFLVEDVAD